MTDKERAEKIAEWLGIPLKKAWLDSQGNLCIKLGLGNNGPYIEALVVSSIQFQMDELAEAKVDNAKMRGGLIYLIDNIYKHMPTALRDIAISALVDDTAGWRPERRTVKGNTMTHYETPDELEEAEEERDRRDEDTP